MWYNCGFCYLCAVVSIEEKMPVVKLDDAVKARLDRLKGKRTYNDYVEQMVSYFEVTKIVPETSFLPPTEEVKKQISRVIEVVRGIEKKQSAQLEAIRTSLLGRGDGNGGDDDFISLQEAQELLDRYKALEGENQKLKDENKRLQILQEKKPLPQGDFSTEKSGNLPLAARILEDLEGKFEPDRFDPQYQRIDKSVLTQAISRIKDLL